MGRIILTDGTKWFDTDKAQIWEEAVRYNGRNWVSLATGTPWDHQRLYRTKTGRWVLHSWTQWLGGKPSEYIEVSPKVAAEWLIRNDHALPDDLSPHLEEELEI